MIKKRSFILLSVWVVIIGCFNVACSGEKHTSQLSWGKYYLWNAPDSAFQILRTIPSPEKLSKEEYSLYALLMTQVMHRCGQEISSDSLIDIAVKYYSSHGTSDEKASAFLYKGYVLESLGKDTEAIYAYKQAEEAVKSAKDLRIHFLVYVALGHINGRYAHYEQSVGYYKKALDLNLSVPSWKAMGGSSAFIPLYLGQGTPRYNEEVKLVQDKFFDIVSKENPRYNPAEDRAKLEHWLNVSRHRWADRLEALYPSLTNNEKDICFLFVLGLGFDDIADLLGVQSRSVDRVVYRICRKMGLGQGSKEEFVAQINRMGECATNK